MTNKNKSLKWNDPSLPLGSFIKGYSVYLPPNCVNGEMLDSIKFKQNGFKDLSAVTLKGK